MTVTVIELNDSEIRVARNGEIVLRSPGYAVVKPDRIEVGENALRIARLNPRETHNRYWTNLNQDALAVPSRLARHHADLAFTQLLDIHEKAGKPEEVIFAVPGSYSNEQLSLLLGIVEACPFNAIGLVDSAVASAAAVAGSGGFTHIDIFLHHTVLTHMEVSDTVARTSVQVIEDCGLTDIYDACANLISDLFIEQSRFDPQHHGETEQQLYDQIPRCLQALQEGGEVMMEIQYHDTRHQIKLLRDVLLGGLNKFYNRILEQLPGENALMVGDRLSRLPDFGRQFDQAGFIQANAVFQGCQQHQAEIAPSGPGVSFITRLPASRSPVIPGRPRPDKPAETTPAVNRDGSVTHILHNHRAYPLTGELIYVSADAGISRIRNENSHCSVMLKDHLARVNPETKLTVFINGRRIKSASAAGPGDTLTFAGSDTVYRFINVLGV